MSRYGGGGRERERDREYDRRRSVDVTFEERERDSFSRDREFRFDENFETYNSRETRNSGALVPIHQERIIERDIIAAPEPQERFMEIERIERIDPVIEVEVEKKITEHEHEHHHHHIVIDHGTTYINAAPPPPPPPPAPKVRAEVRERETTRVTLEGVRERRYGTSYRASGNLALESEYIPERPREREREREVKIEYKKYDDYSYENPRHSSGMLHASSPRSSFGNLGTFQERDSWNIVDVDRRYNLELDGRIKSGVRRNRGDSAARSGRKELWTEVTKDLVAREALEEFGFYYEETDDFMYIFEYLSRDQITDLIELTKDIRREKVREMEREGRERARSRPAHSHGHGQAYEHDRITERRDFTPYGERDRFTERRDIYYN